MLAQTAPAGAVDFAWRARSIVLLNWSFKEGRSGKLKRPSPAQRSSRRRALTKPRSAEECRSKSYAPKWSSTATRSRKAAHRRERREEISRTGERRI